MEPVLERTATYKSVIILGDVNIQLDILDNPFTVKFNRLLSVFGLSQHIRQPTHSGGHLLDVIIARTDAVLRSLQLDPPMLSDHCQIVAEFDMPVRRSTDVVRHVRRCWRSFDCDEFVRDVEQSSLIQSPPVDVDELFTLYDVTLRSLLHKHAPYKIVRLRPVESSARWYSAECRAEKTKTRRLEKTYRRLRTPESLVAWREQFVHLRCVLDQRFTSYWTQTINENKHDSRALWSQVNTLLKPPPSPVPHTLSASDFSAHFRAKVDSIRAATAGAPEPDITPREVPRLSDLAPVTTCEISELLRNAPPKHCDQDPVPTWLVKKASSVFAPLLSRMCNASLSAGVLPVSQKHATVRPLLKKPTLDAAALSSYRPISNLTFTSKLVEKVVASRFMRHIADNNLLPDRQSAYRRFHSTETAIAAVHNDLVRAADSDRVTALILLDLSSAFDTVDHSIMLTVLSQRFGIDGQALEWFRSYLADRTQSVVVNGSPSETTQVDCSVPQGSVLGPLKFISYTEDVTLIFDRHGVRHHLFADDKQAYTDASLSGVDDARCRLHDCTADLVGWCASRRLQLNEAKTELAWFGKPSRLASLVSMGTSVTVGSSTINPSSAVRDLGVILDAELTLKPQIARMTSTCFYQLRRLKHVRHSVGQELTAQLVHAFVLSRLDYGNSVLAGLPKSTIAPLQRVQNAAARLILGLRARDHVTPALRQLHWLPVHQRIQHKLCTMMHSIHYGMCPVYLADIVSATADNPTRPGLRSAGGTLYRLPRCRTSMGERGFSYSGPRAWNALPSTLRDIPDRARFRKLLKTHLFDSSS